MHILLSKYSLDVETETLLLFSARNEHIKKVILPHLKNDFVVLCDRFTDATFAYQGGGSGIAMEKIKILENWMKNTLIPDITFYLDISIEHAQSRFKANRKKDRFELEEKKFYDNVRNNYLMRAKKYKNRIIIINARNKKKEINKIILENIDL